jgi:transposase-like protein
MAFRYSASVGDVACRRMLAGERVEEVADDVEISASTLYRWKRQALVDVGRKPGVKSFEPDGIDKARRRIKDLEAELELVKAASALLRVVGWAIDRRNEATLVNDALTMAATSRGTSPGTLLHSDHGSQFTSWSFTANLKHHQLLGSMGTIGDCFDNAPMESFWGSMQIELLNRRKWMTDVELSTAMADYIVNFYNQRRRQSSLDYHTPDEFEALPSTNTQPRTPISVDH